jgi:isocitrate lyase
MVGKFVMRERGVWRISSCMLMPWDAPHTVKGYCHYGGSMQCVVNHAVVFTPYVDLLWMETKQLILSQVCQFVDSIHSMYPTSSWHTI